MISEFSNVFNEEIIIFSLIFINNTYFWLRYSLKDKYFSGKTHIKFIINDISFIINYLDLFKLFNADEISWKKELYIDL